MSDENKREEEREQANTREEPATQGEPQSKDEPAGQEQEPIKAREAEARQQEDSAGKESTTAKQTTDERQAETPAAQAEPSDPKAQEPAPAEAQPAAEAAEPAAKAAPAASAAEAGQAQAGDAEPAPVRRKETEEEKAARRKAALEAREAAKAAAAQAAARPAAEGGAAGDAPPPPAPPPSPNQPRLDHAVQLLRELVAEDAVVEASINEPNDHLPTLVVLNERWVQAAQLFRNHEELNANYLRNVSGVDYETQMEVVYHLLSMDSGHNYCVKIRTDRANPSVPSATPVWETANWNEREIYDLLGVDFPGHPDLRRIMMPDDWVGHPLRKDYVPLDPEV